MTRPLTIPKNIRWAKKFGTRGMKLHIVEKTENHHPWTYGVSRCGLDLNRVGDARPGGPRMYDSEWVEAHALNYGINICSSCAGLWERGDD